MNFQSRSKWRRSLLSRRAWLIIFAAAVLIFLMAHVGSRSGSKRAAIEIRLNTNGIPTVLGLPLGNGSVRDITLRTLRWAKVRVRVLVPSGGSGAPGWDA